MTYHVVGIDPGLHGAIAVLRDDGIVVAVYDVPSTVAGSGRGRELNLADLSQIVQTIDILYGPRWCAIEAVQARPVPARPGAVRHAQGASSAFKFGAVYGALCAMSVMAGWPLHAVYPAKWKMAMKVTADKEQTRAAASRLLPSGAHLWPLKQNVDRAEAALLAAYGLRHF